MQDDQDNSCERVVLKGTIKAINCPSLSGQIIANLNLGIKKYTFSGARIDRVAINQKGGSGSTGLRNFKDDTDIHRTIKTLSLAKNIEYRF